MSDPLFKDSAEEDSETDKHDGFDMIGSLLGKINIWIAFLLFIIFILMNTHFFIDDVMKKINGDFVALDGNLTSSGVIVQGVMLSLSYIVVDLLVSGGII